MSQVLCDLCNRDIGAERRRALFLASYGVQTSIGHTLVDYATDEDDDPDVLNAWALCWPDCATQWIDAKMLETNAVVKRMDRG